MAKKNIMFICIIIIAIIALISFKIGSDKKNSEFVVDPIDTYRDDYETMSESIELKYNEENNSYDIIDNVTNEIIVSFEDEEMAKSELEFYKENPSYRANPPFELEEN